MSKEDNKDVLHTIIYDSLHGLVDIEKVIVGKIYITQGIIVQLPMHEVLSFEEIKPRYHDDMQVRQQIDIELVSSRCTFHKQLSRDWSEPPAACLQCVAR